MIWRLGLFSVMGASSFANAVQIVEPQMLLIPGNVYFECTIINLEKLAESDRKRFFDLKKYSGVRADVIDDQQLLVSLGKTKLKISLDRAKKMFLGPAHEKIELQVGEKVVTLDLEGKPLSRNGNLVISSNVDASKLAARVTCH